MKKIVKIIPVTFLLLSSFSAAFIVNNTHKAESIVPVEASSTGYKVRVKIDVTNDADYWYGAKISVNTKPDCGRGTEHFYTWSEDFHDEISYGGASYTTREVNCGTEFPYLIGLWTDVGFWGQYHAGESDVTVYINGINVASQHVSYGGWGNNMEYNWIHISDGKYPYPVEKKIVLNYSENVDPGEEDSQIVSLSATDQYGVNWTTPASNPITLVNETYPESDTATRLDDSGFRWKLNSTLVSNHYSIYCLKLPTISSVYPLVEKRFKVQFAFPLHLSIMVDGKLAYKVSAFEGDVIKLPTEYDEIPTGYYISNYKKTGMGTIEQDKQTDIFSFTFISGDTVLTATLKPITYTVHFNQNGAGVSGTVLDKKVSYNAKNIYLPTNRFTREGYKFIGWNTEKDGSGTSYENKALIFNLTSKKGDVVNLYAQWESTNPSVTASLFTDGSFGLIFGGVVMGGAITAIVIFFVYKSKKRKV